MPEPAPTDRIVAENLTKRYGALPAIQDLSFRVAAGEVVGFLGPNGAGKSTTMRILTGLLAASSGAAWVNGVPVASDPQRARARLGYMPENNPLPEDLRVREYLKFRAHLKGIPARHVSGRVDEALAKCDLQRKAARRVIGKLSKGFRQRVGIADAILTQPAVTILDEPTIGLDPHQVILIRRLIESLRETTTILISSHILAEVEVSCDRVLILNQGRLVASGPVDALQQEFVQEASYVVEVKGTRDALLAVVEPLEAEFALRDWQPLAEGWARARLETAHAANCLEGLWAALTQADQLPVRALARQEPRLEDIFLAATKRSWEAEYQPAAAKPPAPDSAPTDPSTPSAASSADSA